MPSRGCEGLVRRAGCLDDKVPQSFGTLIFNGKDFAEGQGCDAARGHLVHRGSHGGRAVSFEAKDQLRVFLLSVRPNTPKGLQLAIQHGREWRQLALLQKVPDANFTGAIKEVVLAVAGFGVQTHAWR